MFNWTQFKELAARAAVRTKKTVRLNRRRFVLILRKACRAFSNIDSYKKKIFYFAMTSAIIILCWSPPALIQYPWLWFFCWLNVIFGLFLWGSSLKGFAAIFDNINWPRRVLYSFLLVITLIGLWYLLLIMSYILYCLTAR